MFSVDEAWKTCIFKSPFDLKKQTFWNILANACLQHVYSMTDLFQLWKLHAVVGSIVVAGVLTRCAYFFSVFDLKTA